MSADLTKRQKTVYECIKSFIASHGYGPTVREVCSELGLRSPSTVHVHLNALEEKGLITRDPLKSRSIALVEQDVEELPTPVNDSSPYQHETHFGSSYTNTVKLPLVGNVAAGMPLLAEENIQDYLTLPTEIVGDAASFLLSVHGDSMIEAGINNGDYIVVKEQQTAQNGEIVVALVDDGATVKRFFKEKDHIRLQPENSSMDPIIVDDCAIVGKVVALFRRVY